MLRENPMKTALYPDPDSSDLRIAIARLLNETGGVLSRAQTGGKTAPDPQDAIGFDITPDMIFCGNGSDEVLSFVFYAFFDDDRPLVTLEHTYSFYPVYALYYGIGLKKIPLTKDWRVDCKEIARAANDTRSSVIFANPNAPTGIGLSRDEARALLEACPIERVMVIDEAYVDFGGQSVLPLLRDFPNLVIIRTFSKSLSAAGLRLGYAVASPALIDTLTTVKNSFNHFPVDSLTQCAGIAACGDAAWYAHNAAQIASEREEISTFLRQKNWTPLPSQTNFVFAKKEGVSGRAIYEAIRDEGILIRHFATPGIEDFVRITIGTKDQMTALKQAIGRRF
jgi:histidinol-phosphate aminotransferase